MKYLLIILFGILFFTACTMNITSADTYSVRILSVSSGDKITVRFDDEIPAGCSRMETVQLIGVTAPKLTLPPEYFAYEAYSFSNQLLFGSDVKLKIGEVSRTTDGHVNAYIYFLSDSTVRQTIQTISGFDVSLLSTWISSDSFLFNELLIMGGYAYYNSSVQFNKTLMDYFLFAETDAKYYKRGVWK